MDKKNSLMKTIKEEVSILKPLLISFFFFILVVLCWNSLKLPYDESNLIIGEYYYKKFNPNNETIRFSLIIILPSIIYLLLLIKYNKNLRSIIPTSENFFLKSEKKNIIEFNSKKITILLLIYITIEFLLLDFNNFIVLEFYHDAGPLVAPKNFLEQKSINSTFYDHGFLAYNIGLISHYLFGFYSPATIKVTKLFVILINKFLLLLITKKIIENVDFRDWLKQLFFLIFGYISINLPNYYDSNDLFSERYLFYLLFLITAINAFTKKFFLNLTFYFLGIFSLINILWMWDVGIYTNAMIILISIILIIQKKFSNLFYLYLGVFSSWLIFFLIIPTDSIKDYLSDLTEYIFKVVYVMGIEYAKPFSEGSTRATRALLIIYLTTVMTINLNFIKKFKLDYPSRVILNLIFFSSIFFFNSALVRSDSIHLRSASGFYTYLFIFLVLYFLFLKISNTNILSRMYIFYQKFYSSLLFALIILIILFLKFDLFKSSTIKIINFKKNFNNYVKLDDETFLANEHLQNVVKGFNYKNILNYYQIISKDDNCVQVLTADVLFPYFIGKPTCTKFYNTIGILSENYQKKFIEQMSITQPEIILYDSPVKHLPTIKQQENMIDVLNYINKNYKFYKNYNGFVFYKKTK